MPEHNIGILSDFPRNEMKKAEVNGKEILIANINGKLYAINNICTHEECSLSEGILEDSIVVCPCHQAKFDMKTGKNMEMPITGETIDDEQSYRIKTDGNKVFITL